MRRLDSITDSIDINLSKLQETVENMGVWCAEICGVTESQTRLSVWTTTPTTIYIHKKDDSKCFHERNLQDDCF